MERKIGNVFKFEGKWIKVQEAESLDFCEHCYFEKEECSRFRSFIGECTRNQRSDKKSVVFADITYIPEKNLQAEQPQQEEQQDEEIKERKVGEIFEYKGHKLKVMESEDGCTGCYFKESSCRNNRLIGECIYCRRNDKTGVIFVEVQEQQDEEIKERKVGEIFEYQGKKLKVVETKGSICNNCYFENRECSNENISKVCGACLRETRTDNKPVIFMEVKEEPEEQPQELNLCEVLKYCPQGETFWSPMLGDVKLNDIDQESKKINVILASGATWDINADGTITIDNVTSPEVMLYPSSEQMAWTKVKYEKKKELPRTWEEFCNQNRITKLEYYIDDSSDVRKAKTRGGIRHEKYDRNVLPSKQAAEAHLAYKQLHQLRDAWREGWLPDWTDEDQTKYVILNTAGEFTIRGFYSMSCFLAFQDEKRADEFLDCFIDLIRKAGDLI